MYTKLANSITDFFVQHQIIPKSERDNYAFGYEVLISETVYVFIMLVISLAFSAFVESLLFFIGFFVFRKLAGGYHAATYLRCHIIFALNQIACLILLSFIPSFLYSYIFLTLAVLLPVITFISAPIDNENKPFNTKEYKRYKKLSRIFIIIFSFFNVGAVFIFDNLNSRCVFALCIGVLSANISLLYAYIKRRVENEKV